MFQALAKKIFGTVNERIINQLQPTVAKINACEEKISKLSDSDLKAKTDEFKNRLKNGETIDDIIPEAFAVVREAAKRTLNMRHFDVQLIGGLILHQGQIAEMKTGEGKTLVATLAVYVNALEGKGVHVVTVNDYLAKRDSEWMGTIYKFLGLSVGCILHEISDDERREAYNADVTYGTNNEFGFDYLRDNMKFTREEMVQREFNFAIVDEVDSILVDEARTPLIISGPTEDNSELYHAVDKIIPLLKKDDYEIDEKSRTATLTEDGTEHAEQLLKKHNLLNKDASLYDINSISLVHHLNQALKAHTLFQSDKDYIVKDDSVVIIDEFTGRMMEGRRYSDGLHQALEAKEKVSVQNENQTLASITFQNYFRLYPKLAGMTGTAMTEAAEFSDIYKLEVIEIPPNLIISRIDEDDEIYRTAKEKYEAIADIIADCHKRGQPILVGTVSIEQSELVAKFLKKKKVPHNILNAKHHEREAHIIAQAGRLKAVTIATNMAGRGTDIMLGGNPEMLLEDELSKKKADKEKLEQKIAEQVKKEKEEVIKAGGLFVLGTERHESRRVDNQLRGRSGRQGDPGTSRFMLSMEDDLLRIFGAERISGLMQRMGMEEGQAIGNSKLMNRTIEKAQQKVENLNYEMRKTLLRFDDVMNDQRKVIYDQRIELMETDDVSETVNDMVEEINEQLVDVHIPPKSYAEQWDTEGLEKEIFRIYGIQVPVQKLAKKEGVADTEILEEINKATDALLKGKVAKYSEDIMRLVEKKILLLTLDQLWKDHLLSLDHLRQGINLRAYGQKDPLNEYKREAFYMFQEMLSNIKEVTVTRLAHTELSPTQHHSAEELEAAPEQKHTHESRIDPAMARAQEGRQPVLGQVRTHIAPEDRNPADPSTWGKVGRNELCPCGSGKKYKQCHGKIG